jgi:hypothetical protein
VIAFSLNSTPMNVKMPIKIRHKIWLIIEVFESKIKSEKLIAWHNSLNWFLLPLWKTLKYKIPQSRKIPHAIRSERLTTPLTASTWIGWQAKIKAVKNLVFLSISIAFRNGNRRQVLQICKSRFTVFIDWALSPPSSRLCRANVKIVSGR